jgi:hypothetical protein
MRFDVATRLIDASTIRLQPNRDTPARARPKRPKEILRKYARRLTAAGVRPIISDISELDRPAMARSRSF